ncbi:hypothetical protein F183_A09620 [Bryobacterales bacterium F-183]|nr:hypothetical protein F183_A09620 [Bryobacterales bacterium F-183]
MRLFALACALSAAATTFGQVQFTPDSVAVQIDGKPFTTFYYGEAAAKPYFAPLRSASGKIVTRRFPMETVPGESRDHLHHRGLWFTYDDVNGVKLWENDPSYTNKPNKGHVTVKSNSWDAKKAVMTSVLEWRDEKEKVLLVEDRTVTFVTSDPKLRVMDFRITLSAPNGEVKLGDTKEGAFAIRLAEEFTEKRGGVITNADGLTGMKQLWGKPSNWVDYSATLDGEPLGVAMFDHPSNPGHPTRWHARDYGLFSLNPFGQKGFDPAQPEKITTIAAGKKLTYRWRVVIHPGDAKSANVDALYKAWAGSNK